MALSMLVAVVELVLLALLAVGVMKFGKMILAQTGRVLPGGRIERLGVLVIAAASVLYFVGDTAFTNTHLGVFVFMGGISLVFAYAND